MKYEVGTVIEQAEPLPPPLPEEPPVDSAVVDRDGDVWKRYEFGWVWAGNDDYEAWEIVLSYSPLKVVWVP